MEVITSDNFTRHKVQKQNFVRGSSEFRKEFDKDATKNMERKNYTGHDHFNSHWKRTRENEVSLEVEGRCSLPPDPTDSLKAAFGGTENELKSCGTPLRLRRLPASFWQEPNIPKGSSSSSTRKPIPNRGCFGSCNCHPFRRHLFQKDLQFNCLDYDVFGSKTMTRPVSKFSDPADFVYLDPAASSTWQPGAVPAFPSTPAGRCCLPPVFVASDNPAFTTTLYDQMMRGREAPSNYRHGNCGDYMADRLLSPGTEGDLWRLLPPGGPLANVFNKRFHPYL